MFLAPTLMAIMLQIDVLNVTCAMCGGGVEIIKKFHRKLSLVSDSDDLQNFIVIQVFYAWLMV